MPECMRCGGHVTKTYHRVNCNNDGELWSCPECSKDGEVLISEDDESESRLYEENLEEIKNNTAKMPWD